MSATDGRADRSGKASGRTLAMHDHGKSDRLIVPKKRLNKPGQPGAEVAEGRGLTKGNPLKQKSPGRRAGQEQIWTT